MDGINRRSFLGSLGAAAAGLSVPRAMADESQTDAEPAELTRLPGRTPHSRFAANLEIWWKDQPFVERIAEAAKLGYPAIEFWDWFNKDVDAIAARTRELGIAVAQCTGARDLNDPTKLEANLETIAKSCAIAKRLNTKLLTVLAGENMPGKTQDEMHGHVITALRRAAPIAEANDITLILEPFNIRVDHPNHCLYGSPAAIRIVKAVNSPNVKINWDLYHMQLSEGDLCGRLRDGFPYVGYLQLADTPGRHEPGTGEIHYNRVLKEAYDLGYRGYVGLECWPSKDELTAARACAAADVW